MTYNDYLEVNLLLLLTVSYRQQDCCQHLDSQCFVLTDIEGAGPSFCMKCQTVISDRKDSCLVTWDNVKCMSGCHDE